MPWVAVPPETAAETRQILLALREARRKAMLGDFRDAPKVSASMSFCASHGSPCDPRKAPPASGEATSA